MCDTDFQRDRGANCPASAGALIVVINADPTRGWSRSALGCALPLVGRGDHAGVFYSRIVKVAGNPTRSVGASEPEILGHVISHELGHLLLHTNMHSPGGLMAADWTPQDFYAIRHSKLLFTQSEAAILRRAVVRREDSAVGAQ